MTEPGVDDSDVDFNRSIIDRLEQVKAFLLDGHNLVAILMSAQEKKEVPPDVVDKARLMINVIRQGFQDGDPIRQDMTVLRDRLVAGVYWAAPDVGVEELGDDAGFGSPYVSRVAKREGVPPRTKRKRRRGC